MTKYLGKTQPRLAAELFLAGNFIDTEDKEVRSFNPTFSPDGKEMFFSYVKGTEEIPEPFYEIKTFKYIDDEWIGPKTASFSGLFSDVDINFSPDGKFVFFCSERYQLHPSDLDIYFSEKTETGWSKPIYAGDEVNTTSGEVYPSLSKKKNLFFRSSRPGGYSYNDLYKAEWVNGSFRNVKNLGPNVNSPYGQSNAVIAPDESYILLSTKRPEQSERGQIFISFQISENVWTKAESIGPEVNTENGEGSPTITPDGKIMFFSRGGDNPGMYWIRTEFIEKLKERFI